MRESPFMGALHDPCRPLHDSVGLSKTPTSIEKWCSSTLTGERSGQCSAVALSRAGRLVV